MPYKIHSVQIDVDSYGVGAEQNIPDCISHSLSNNPVIDAIVTAGDTMPRHLSLISHAISGGFESFAIAKVIDAIGLQPLCIATDTEPGVTFFLQKFNACGSAVSTNTHRSLLVSSGMIVPRSLTCDHQGHARISVDVIVAKEGANNAIVISDAATLPTLTGGGLRWTLGSVKVGNISLTDYTSLSIDFGNTVSTRGTQSDVFDAYVEVAHHAPTITVNGIDPAWFKESGGIPIAGLACTHANTIIYLRKRDTDGQGFVADGTAEHIKFTCKGVAAVQAPHGGQMHSFTNTSLVIRGVYDGTDDPIEVDTTSAIT
jgi:hypothetical protein